MFMEFYDFLFLFFHNLLYVDDVERAKNLLKWEMFFFFFRQFFRDISRSIKWNLVLCWVLTCISEAHLMRLDNDDEKDKYKQF